jgi:hypothetical protein
MNEIRECTCHASPEARGNKRVDDVISFPDGGNPREPDPPGRPYFRCAAMQSPERRRAWAPGI